MAGVEHQQPHALPDPRPDSRDDLVVHLAMRAMAPPGQHVGAGEDLFAEPMLGLLKCGCPGLDVPGLVQAIGDALVHPPRIETADGVILPFAEVDCDGIRGFLRAELIHMQTGEREGAYGRAIGRVLAHELYHIFANTREHGTSGVAKPAYSVRELLSSVFTFEGPASAAIRSGKGMAALQADAAGR